MCSQSLSCVRFLTTSWTLAYQGPLSMKFSRQECWSGLPFPIPGNHPDPGINPEIILPPTLAGGFFTTVPPRKPGMYINLISIKPGKKEKVVAPLLFTHSASFIVYYVPGLPLDAWRV